MILLKFREIKDLDGFGETVKGCLLVHNGKARHSSRRRRGADEELLRRGDGFTLGFWYPEISEYVRKNYPEELL